MRRFLGCLRPYFRLVAGQLAIGSACGILMNTAVVLPALCLGRALDRLLEFQRGAATREDALRAAAFFALATLATEVPRIGKRWWLGTANSRIIAHLRADAFRGIVSWPMARLSTTPIGHLMARLGGDVKVVATGIKELTVETWDTLLFSASIVTTLALMQPRLTAVALAPVPLGLLLAKATGRWIAARTRLTREVSAGLTAAIQENLAGVRVLRLFGRTGVAVREVAGHSRRQAEVNLALARLRSGLTPAYGALMTAGIVVVVWSGGHRVLDGVMTSGTFVAYLELFVRFVGRAHRIPQLVNAVQSAAAAFERVEPLLALPLDGHAEPRWSSFRTSHMAGLASPPGSRARTRSGPGTRVSVRDLTFTYPGCASPALSGINLEIAPGELIALTGPIGSGKTALARCLAGIHIPDQGEVLLDGEPAHLAARSRVGYAPQEGLLFSGTLLENVFLGEEPEPLEAERAAGPLLALAELEDDVQGLPLGLKTPIGELGIRLAGGQRQRLALARAMAAQGGDGPSLLILDDPFGAVDVETEMRIVASLRSLLGRLAAAGGGITVVLLSHRLAAFPHADRVLVLDRGVIAQQGTHGGLVAAGGAYARIYAAQRRAHDDATAARGDAS